MPRSFFIRRRRRRIVEQAHRLFYLSGVWGRTRWLGTKTAKNPLDLWVFQEIVFETRPDLIVETGTLNGGSAAFLASLCELVGSGEVISIDLNPVSPNYPQHPRIAYLGGRSSTAPEVVETVRERAQGKRTMVILDSDHSAAHVAAELVAYSPFVSPGCYLIVEDTNVGAIRRDLLPGPAEAVRAFLSRANEFEVDRAREKYLITFNPGGYLRRRG
ncbi:MAG: CmcI family methyltransferase [Gaiellaceae bacterium]